MMKRALFLLTIGLATMLMNRGWAQEDLMTLMEKGEKPVIDYTSATFKTTRVVIGQSIENPAKRDMLFLITHHFGKINSGYQSLFGLNQAFIRLGLEYGITDWMAIGVGLNTYQLTWDGFVKFKVLRQSKGARVMPISMTVFASTAVSTIQWSDPDRDNLFSSRISYAYQLIIARKFNDWLSLQIMPEMVHKNLVTSAADHNDLFAIGAGGRVKVSNRVSINAEYHYLFPNQVKSQKVYNSFSLGVDIETGGHVFQIFLTNSTGEIEQSFIPETTGNWLNGDIFLGFNISRIFTL